MRVLLVEDGAALAGSVELMLKAERWTVDASDLGGEGVDLGKFYDYDIILLDPNLPDMSGYEGPSGRCSRSPFDGLTADRTGSVVRPD